MANKKTMKKFLLIALVVACITALGVFSVSAEVYSGTCGADDGVSNVTWSFDTETGVLTIAGAGEMADYENCSSTPWYDFSKQIKKIVIEDGVTRIGKCAFQQSSMTEITIADSVETIGYHAFNNCVSLTEIVIPKNVCALEGLDLATCHSLVSITVDEENQTYRSEGNCIIKGDTLVSGCAVSVIPSDGSIKKINWDAFLGCRELTEIVIPEGVETIGGGAFMVCKNLTSVTLPESLKHINDGAFKFCTKLESLHLGKNVIHVSDTAFEGAENLTVTVSEENMSLHMCPSTDKAESFAWKLDNGEYKLACDNCATVRTSYKASRSPILSLDFETPIEEALDAEKMPVTITKAGTCEYVEADDGKGLLVNGSAVFMNDTENAMFSPDKMITTFDIKFNGNEKTDFQESIVTFIYGMEGSNKVSESALWVFVLRYIEDTEGNAFLSFYNTNTDVKTIAVEEGKWYSCAVIAKGNIYELWIDGKYMGSKTRPDYSDEAYNGATTFRIGDNKGTNFTIDNVVVAELVVADGEMIEMESGECGENATWSYDAENKTIYINGTGAMTDYVGDVVAPWKKYAREAKTVVISEGITYIGANSFKNFVQMLTLKLPSTLENIGENAFKNTWKKSEIINMSSLKLVKNSTSPEYGYVAQSVNEIHKGDSKIVYVDGYGFHVMSSTFCVLVDYVGTDSVITLPESPTGSTYNLGSRVFQFNENITEVNIQNVIYIGSTVFLDCINLKKVTVDDTATNIGVNVFSGCDVSEIIVDENNAYLYVCKHSGELVPLERLITADGDVQVICGSCKTLIASYKMGDTSIFGLDFETAIEEALDPEKMPVTVEGNVEYVDRDGTTAFKLAGGKVFVNDTESVMFSVPQAMATFDLKFPAIDETSLEEAIITFVYGMEGSSAIEGATKGFNIVVKYYKRNDGSLVLGIGGDDIVGKQIAIESDKWYSCTVLIDVKRIYLYVDDTAVGSIPRNDYTDDIYCGGTTLRIGDGKGSGAIIDNLAINVAANAHTKCVFDRELAVKAYFKEAANCTHGTVYYKSCICGNIGTDTFVYGEPVHNFGTWSYNESIHIRHCDCGASESYEHSWDDGVVLQEPTCAAEGIKSFHCTVCEATNIESIPATENHNYGEWNNYDKDQHSRACECGLVDYADHNWDDGVIAETVKTYTCTVCEATRTESVQTDASVTVENVKYYKVNETVSVDIVVANNPGIICMQLKVEYDPSVFTLISVTDGDILGTQNHTDNLTSPYYLSWQNFATSENITANGTIATLTFKVSEDAAEGEYPITVSYDYDNADIVDVDMNNVAFAMVSGSVSVNDVLFGDVNRDGKINTIDGIFLGRYLAKWSGYTSANVDLDAADVNCDGKVNTLDGIILGRHLAKWSGYNALPYGQ